MEDIGGRATIGAARSVLNIIKKNRALAAYRMDELGSSEIESIRTLQ